MRLLFEKKKCLDNLPTHIGFIMDGNGRWAKKRKLPRQIGHSYGAAAFKKIVRYSKDIGIKYITFYAFSTENWKRPKQEIDAILSLFGEYIDEVRSHIDENVRVIFIGDRCVFSDELKGKMTSLEEDSCDFTAMTLVIAVNYGGRAEILHAAGEIARLSAEGKLSAGQIDEKLFSSLLYTGGLPDVDLVIRPSGEFRISNFLIWQSAYAEFYFTDVLWPDFTPKELKKALESYAARSRRFGGI